MLPVYRANSYLGIIDKGARTQPWLVLIDTGNNIIKPYVVKMFEPTDINNRDCVAKEIFGNVLAKPIIRFLCEKVNCFFFQNSLTLGYERKRHKD